MRRSLVISLALLLLVQSASPVLAARSGSNGGQRGSISATLANTKGDPTTCTVKASARYLAPGQNLYLGHYPLPNENGWLLGATNANGTLDGAVADVISRSEWDNSHVLLVITDGWVAVLDAGGSEAVFSIANNCRPA